MKNLLCLLGFHKWEQNRSLHISDIFPFYLDEVSKVIRTCKICGKKEEWLPGYGGSEIGCWVLKKKE